MPDEVIIHQASAKLIIHGYEMAALVKFTGGESENDAVGGRIIYISGEFHLQQQNAISC
jgi:hypothetical protein